MKAEKTDVYTLLKSGVKPEQIQERTGLSRGRISQIKKEMTRDIGETNTEHEAIVLEAKYILLQAMRSLADKIETDTPLYHNNDKDRVEGIAKLYRLLTED